MTKKFRIDWYYVLLPVGNWATPTSFIYARFNRVYALRYRVLGHYSSPHIELGATL